MKAIIDISHSATIMTWFSLSAKLLTPILLLPIVLTSFTAGEVALWFLFNIISSLQQIFDMGFSQTFIRIIAYATSGKPLVSFNNNLPKQVTVKTEHNYSKNNISNIISTMDIIYLRLGLATFILLGIFGTLTLINPISEYANNEDSWHAWLIVLAVTATSVWGGKYSALLQGMNKIAEFRLWETITSFTGIIACVLVVLYGGSLFLLILTNQLFALVAIVRNYWLCSQIEEAQFSLPSGKIDKTVYDLVWPSAWRSGIAI